MSRNILNETFMTAVVNVAYKSIQAPVNYGSSYFSVTVHMDFWEGNEVIARSERKGTAKIF